MKKVYMVEKSRRSNYDTEEYFYRTKQEALSAASDLWDAHKKSLADSKNLIFTVYEIEAGCYPDRTDIAVYKEEK